MSKGRPKVYFARGVDDLSEAAVLGIGARIARALASHGIEVLDPVAELATRARKPTTKEIVEHDLSRLRRSDAVLMDMSIAHRNYIGCSCELVYAHLWRIPAVVYVGRSGNQRRHWLRYHAVGVHASYRQAIAHLLTLLEIHIKQIEELH